MSYEWSTASAAVDPSTTDVEATIDGVLRWGTGYEQETTMQGNIRVHTIGDGWAGHIVDELGAIKAALEARGWDISVTLPQQVSRTLNET